MARAADVADFYRGQTITIVIGYSAGGGYDIFARLLARHLGRHVPGNPAVVPQNMPGAGSRKAGMYLYKVAPKDGTTIGTIGRNEPIAPLIEDDAGFDGSKFTWIGSVANDNSICLSWHTSPVKTWQDLQSRELTVGALAPGDNTVTVPLALRNLFGAKLKLVKGYPGTSDLFLALERGEVEGACGVSWRPILTQHRDWIADKKINILVEVALEGDPSLGDTPLITKFVRDPRAAQDAVAADRHPGHGAAVSGAARRPGGSQAGAAARLRRDDEGSALSCRRGEGRALRLSDGGRADRRAAEGSVRHAEGADCTSRQGNPGIARH